MERRRWLDESRFANLVALCQLLPGATSSQLGIAIGTLRAGVAGGIAAWIGFTLPSAVALTAFALLTQSPDVNGAGWIEGLKLAAVAVVAQAVVAMARVLTPDVARAAIAIAVAALMLAVPGPGFQVVAIAGAACSVGASFVANPFRPRGPNPRRSAGGRDSFCWPSSGCSWSGSLWRIGRSRAR